MNWSRAKTILILAFLVTNIILGISIIKETNNGITNNEADTQYYQEVMKILDKKQLKIRSDLPQAKVSMQNATVEYEIYEPNLIASYFFEEPTEKIDEDRISFVEGKEQLEIINSKELFYTNKSVENNYESLNSSKAFDIADEFLKKRQLYDENARKTYIREVDGTYHLLYTKLIDEILVEESSMKFSINQSGVFEFSRLWIDGVEPKGEMIELGDPIEVLLKFLSEDDIENLEIIDLQPCYYFGPGKNNIVDYKNAKRGEGIPSWRILLSNGSKYFFE